MDQERFDRIRLARSEGIGPVSYAQAIHRFGSAGEALRVLPQLTLNSRRPVQVADERFVAREVEQMAAIGAFWLIRGDSDYPALLEEMPDAPPVLALWGDRALLHGRSVAMVGARNASAAACRMAREIGRDLALEDHVVVSGLARGVDTAAHQGALAAGRTGGTIAVIASGINIAYPPENASLQQRITGEGLLIAEQPMGAEPRARNFPYRNRIIAGLSLATLVVEAAPKSGSLITARLAADYGREVLAVPGSPLDERARGCNELIRNGATLIQSAADVIEAIVPFSFAQPGLPLEERLPVSKRTSVSERETPAATKTMKPEGIFSLLGPVPVAVDELIRQSGLDPAMVQMTLLDLELDGRLERHPGARVALRPVP